VCLGEDYFQEDVVTARHTLVEHEVLFDLCTLIPSKQLDVPLQRKIRRGQKEEEEEEEERE